jgi:phosphoribosyl 1,2-cyclic phosphodiesterase
VSRAAMRLGIWGTRGSIATPGPQTARYGGNTACVTVEGTGGTVLVLDAGTGIRLAGAAVPANARRVDVLLTHLHMDHIIGLGFFPPLQRRGLEVHIWGPKTAGDDLRTRLTRYLSPPLFPVRLRDLPAAVTLHEIASAELDIGEFHVTSSFVTHPDPALGFRVSRNGRSIAYLPDHEPALGVKDFPVAPQWTSGHRLAAGADLLLHDSQYTEQEYGERIGFGHSSIAQSVAFAKQAGAGKLLLFHHDPTHDDATMDSLTQHAALHGGSAVGIAAAIEGATIEV